MLTESVVVSFGQLSNEWRDQSLDRFRRQFFAADFGQLLEEDVDEVKLEAERRVKDVFRLFVCSLSKENNYFNFISFVKYQLSKGCLLNIREFSIDRI